MSSSIANVIEASSSASSASDPIRYDVYPTAEFLEFELSVSDQEDPSIDMFPMARREPDTFQYLHPSAQRSQNYEVFCQELSRSVLNIATEETKIDQLCAEMVALHFRDNTNRFAEVVEKYAKKVRLAVVSYCRSHYLFNKCHEKNLFIGLPWFPEVLNSMQHNQLQKIMDAQSEQLTQLSKNSAKNVNRIFHRCIAAVVSVYSTSDMPGSSEQRPSHVSPMLVSIMRTALTTANKTLPSLSSEELDRLRDSINAVYSSGTQDNAVVIQPRTRPGGTTLNYRSTTAPSAKRKKKKKKSNAPTNPHTRSNPSNSTNSGTTSTGRTITLQGLERARAKGNSQLSAWYSSLLSYFLYKKSEDTEIELKCGEIILDNSDILELYKDRGHLLAIFDKCFYYWLVAPSTTPASIPTDPVCSLFQVMTILATDQLQDERISNDTDIPEHLAKYSPPVDSPLGQEVILFWITHFKDCLVHPFLVEEFGELEAQEMLANARAAMETAQQYAQQLFGHQELEDTEALALSWQSHTFADTIMPMITAVQYLEHVEHLYDRPVKGVVFVVNYVDPLRVELAAIFGKTSALEYFTFSDLWSALEDPRTFVDYYMGTFFPATAPQLRSQAALQEAHESIRRQFEQWFEDNPLPLDPEECISEENPNSGRESASNADDEVLTITRKFKRRQIDRKLAKIYLDSLVTDNPGSARLGTKTRFFALKNILTQLFLL